MPFGYVIAVGVTAAGMALALRPLGRSGRRGRISWILSAVPNESPFLAFYWILASTLLALVQGDLGTPIAWVGLGLAVVSFAGTPVLVRRSLRARDAIGHAFAETLGGSTTVADASRGSQAPSGRLPWGRILFAPLPLFPPRVERRSNLRYGEARTHRLDVYRRRRGRVDGPILIHLHGGAFRTGRKSFEGRPLLHRLARRGWLCISANYRLRPAATFPDYVVDVKRVIAWARAHAHEYGADSTRVYVAGSSAGAHLACMAALTAGDPVFQPGFEDVDTSISGAIGLYGYYGPVDATRQPLPSSPVDYVSATAPAILVAHGDQDTFVPPEHARWLVGRLRSGGAAPVVYVELPGAQHSFDLLHSIRFEILVDGIERFVTWVESRDRQAAGAGTGPQRRAGRNAA